MQTGTYNARVGTGNSRGNARCASRIAGCHTGNCRGPQIIFICVKTSQFNAIFDGVILVGSFNFGVYLTNRSCIRVSFAIFQIGDFIAADIHIAAADSRTVGAQFNLGSCSGSGAGGLVADGRDARQIFCQLNGEAAGTGYIIIYFTIIDSRSHYNANVIISQFAAVFDTTSDAHRIDIFSCTFRYRIQPCISRGITRLIHRRINYITGELNAVIQISDVIVA